MSAQVILVEAQPRRVVDGVAETVRLAGAGAKVPFAYGGYSDWRAGVVGLPKIIASLEFEGADFPSGSVPGASEVTWAPSRHADLAAIAGYVWFDAPITVRIGPEGAALPPIALSGTVLTATTDKGQLNIALADPAVALKKPLLTTRYAGTGGIEGPTEWEGLIKRRVWGRIWNLRAEPIDKANNIYCLADPTRPLQSIDAVRDKGAAAAALNVLAWQGTIAATFAALQAAAAPQGGGVACPSIGMVKWWTQPAGDLCADLKGEVGAGYVETTAEIVQRLVQAIGGPAFAAGTIAAATAARSAPVGWVADDDTTTVANMLDALLGNSSLLWLLSAAGEIVIRPWTWGASVATATSHEVKRVTALRPVATRKIGYKRNELKMQRGDLAAIVLVGDVAYPDGSALSDAVAVALATAQAKGKVTIGGPLPALAASAIGDTHIGDDGLFYERVNAGGVLLATFAVTLGGYRPQLAWTLSSAQPLNDAFLTASLAQQVADAAAAGIEALASDGVITINEKITGLIPNDATLEGAWTALSGAAAVAGVSSAAAAAKRTAWQALRNGLVPAWNDVTQDTPVDRVNFRTALVEYDQALEALNKAVIEGMTAAKQVSVAPPSDQMVYCDYTGAAKAGQLPRTMTPVVKRGGVDIRTDNAVSYAISAPAQVAATINNTGGSADKGRITIGAGFTGPGTVQLTVTVDGVGYGPFPILVDREIDAPPATGGGGGGVGPAYDSTFNTVNSTGFTAISDELGPLTITAGQKLVVTAPLDYDLTASATMSRYLVAKAQYWDGAAWQDFPGSPVNGSASVWNNADQASDTGSINLSQEKTGLAAGNYKVRLVAALSSAGTGAVIAVSYGTMTYSVA